MILSPLDSLLKSFEAEQPSLKSIEPAPLPLQATFHSFTSLLREFVSSNPPSSSFSAFVHSAKTVKTQSPSQSQASKDFIKTKNQHLLFFSIKTHEQNSQEISLMNRLIFSKNPKKIIKYYFKSKKLIHEEIYQTNRCNTLDGIYLTLDQWVNIAKKLFVDRNPAEKVTQIATNPLVSSQKSQLSAVEFCEALIQALCEEKKGLKLIEKNQKSSVCELNPNELLAENERLRKENEEMKERLEFYEGNSRKTEQKIIILSEFQEVITKAYRDLLSYAYHLENSTRTIVSFVSDESQKNHHLTEKISTYRQDENQTLLPIFYLTLTESLEILRKNEIVEGKEDFSDFLEATARKSFQERAKHVKRYDDFEYVLQLFKNKRELKS